MPSLLSVRRLSGLQSRLDSPRLRIVVAQTDMCLLDSLYKNVLDSIRGYWFAVEDRVEKYQQITLDHERSAGIAGSAQETTFKAHSDQKTRGTRICGVVEGLIVLTC